MLIDESRVFQVATFGALQLHQSELDQGQVLSEVWSSRMRWMRN
jgi:hypothetical protein